MFEVSYFFRTYMLSVLHIVMHIQMFEVSFFVCTYMLYSHAYLHVRGFVLCLNMVIHYSHAYHMFKISCFVRTYTFTRIHIVMLIAISCIVLEYKTKLITGNALDMRR